jgi:predicted CxxxxCH...CXXCH cytochrome family protein
MIPPGYAGTCLDINPCDGSEERFSIGSHTVSLDNDGDLLVDSDDPDCSTCLTSIARIDGTPPIDYVSLQDACNNANNGDTIMSNKMAFQQDISLDMDKTIYFEGGCSCDFLSSGGKSTVIGNMTVNNGTFVIENGTLEIKPPSEDCADGVDNDNNSLIDCDDPGCADDLACTGPQTEVCTDCADNDGDGLKDCADPDCDSDSACSYDTCTACHGYPPVDESTLVTLTPGTGSVTAGAHATHVNIKSLGCENCHWASVGTGPTHIDNLRITMGFSLFGNTYLGGNYDGQYTASYDSSEPGTLVSSGGSMTCNNIYCHGKLPDGTVWGGGQDTSPQWAGSVTCSSCHDAGGVSTDLPLRHDVHTDLSTYAFDCEICHSETATGSTSIKNQQFHANNSKDVAFSSGGSHDSGTQACSVYCHSDGTGGAPNTAVTFSDADNPGHAPCEKCHRGKSGDALEMASNGHDRLVSHSWVRHYDCYYCHDDTADASGNIKGFPNTKHVNETVDVAVAPEWHIAGEPVPTYDPVTKECDNIYCHSDGTTVSPEVRPFAWTQGHLNCNTCHGHPTHSCDQCHDDGRTGWPVGDEWKAAAPMYINTGPGTERANTHVRHLLTNFSCDNCHLNTILNGACTDCHTDGIPPGSMDEINHINPDYHVNRIKNVVLKDGGTYDQAQKKCYNTACHNGSEPQWGDSVNSLVLCFSCHGTTEDDVDDFAKFNGTQARLNMSEWQDTGHGRPASEGNYVSGNPPADFPGNPCWYCHDHDILHNDETNPFRLQKHEHFEQRFEKECVYCHMEGLDVECLNCHNADNSLAPRLIDLTDPPFSQDHTGYTDGQTSCVTSCHVTDEQRHNTGAGLWTAAEKADVQNQYMMMGVCLICHDDDSNGRCDQCHTGPQYQLGFDPGTGFITAVTSKATSTHFGYKHYEAYENDGTWKGGKFCWDCHDPHGDTNIYMIQNKVATETDGTFGIPIEGSRRDVTFTRKQLGTDYARISAPYDGICNVCHTEMRQHYRYDYGDGHNTGRICTECHEHRFSDSHASGQSCGSCHQSKPVPRHTGFGLPRDCTKCHKGVIGKRMNIMGQLDSKSHHIQGVTITNKHCYACHFEATELGLINLEELEPGRIAHEGYNYKTHESVKDAKVDLVIWGPGTRPAAYEEGTTAVTFTAEEVGDANERTEVAKVTQHCLGCHSDQNNDAEPFNIVDPDNGDCKTPRQYAWDRTSIGARYSQTGTTTWGKYTGVTNAAKKDITKAFSAHGNAVANQGGWDASTGLDGTITNTRAGSHNVQCFDCHGSHGSMTQGVTSSYRTFNGTYNGGNLKEAVPGKGGYIMAYKAAGNTDPESVNPYNTGAAQCFDCHESAAVGTETSQNKFTPWGYSDTFGASAPIIGYKDTSYFGPGTKGSTARYSYRSSEPILGGHLNASMELKGIDGVEDTGDEAQGTINGLCTPCHDPHGVSPTLGDNQGYAVPLLKGTWMTSPYKEDAPVTGNPTGNRGSKSYRSPQGHQYVYTDQRTFAGNDRITEDDSKFAGLCLRCHPKDNLTDEAPAGTWGSLDRIHETVQGWGNNNQHSYPCSKCHQPHNSALPKLLQTNCLDYNHRGRVQSGGAAGSNGTRGSYPKGAGYNRVNCHPTGNPWPDNYWNTVSPW